MIALLGALLAGCGADVSTVMSINTADGGFSGSRVITLLIKNEDLDSVTDGMAGLEKVLKANIPGDLTYAVSAPSESQSQIDFTLEFTSLDDYKAKVTNILAANAENEIVPEIVFEKDDSVFCTGIQFNENFQSFDLLRWYFNALEAAEIISESSSNWYELGSDKLVIDEEEVDDYASNHQYAYDAVEERYLSSCQVDTVMNIDGTFDRTISIEADSYDLEEMAEQMEDFEGYMRSVAPKGVTFSAEAGDSSTIYKYTITGVNAKQIVKMTNAVLQTEGNTFTVKVQPKKDAAGMAEVTIEESLDATYYLDPDYCYVQSNITTYPNFTLTQSENAYHSDGQISYGTSSVGTVNKMVGQWLIGYEKTEVKLDIKDLETLSVELVFTASESLSKEIRDIAFAALKDACGKKGEFSEEDNVAVCAFSGTAEEIGKNLDAFVKFYAPTEEGAEDFSYAQATLKEMNTPSKFTDGISGSIDLDLTEILGYGTPVYISAADGTVITSQLQQDEDGAFADTQFSVTVCTEQLNLVTVIVTGVFALLLLAGVVFAIINRAGFVEWFVLIKEKAKKPAAPAEAVAETAAEIPEAETPAEEVAAETPAQEASAETTVEEASAEDEEEEDEIL